MSEPVRIRDDGRELDRALLRATPPPPPAGLQEQLRRSIEARVATPRSGWRRWMGAGLLGLLGTGTAFALGTSPGRQLLRDLLGNHHPDEVVPAGELPAARGPDWESLPTRAPLPPPAAAPQPAPVRPVRPAKVGPPPAPPVILQPGLRQPPGEWPVATGAPEESDKRPPPPAAASFRITRPGRNVELRATATTIDGHIRGAAVSLRLDGARLTGKIGDQAIDLFLRNDQGGGTIAGEALGFALAPTDDGGIVRGWVPGHSIRVELSRAGLTLYPGCERLLQRQAGGIYQGRCADGQPMQLVLPAAFEAMPLFPRLLALGLLLTERDPIFRLQKPGLFPGPL